MGLQVDIQEDQCQIVIDGELTIYVTNEFKQSLLPGIESCNKLDVDLSKVSEIDSAGLQLLMALKKLDNKTDQKTVRFNHHSQAVVEVLELLNLSARFDDPMILAAEKQS